MIRSRHRRSLAAVAGALILALGLGACGENDTQGALQEGSGSDAVTVSGDFGSSPTWDFSDRVSVTESSHEVLIEGDGPEVETGDSVFVHLSVANGYSEQEVYNDFESPEQAVEAGGTGLVALDKAMEGQTIGSRILVFATPQEAFGEQGNPQLGIGNGDTVVFLVDIMGELSTEPSGKTVKPEAWMPSLEPADGTPTAMDFAGTPKPGDGLRVGYLIKGDGEPTRKGQTIYVNYLGQVYGKKKPFDESFSRGQTFPVELGANPAQVIKGWDQGLRGIPVGSRVILSIPPDLGYGKKGNASAGIKGTDTLFFVVDVLAAR